jgi:uncharacterized protein (TIGR02391 family)
MPPLPDPDTAVGLPVDRLAMLLLQHLDDNARNSKNRENIIGLEVQAYWPDIYMAGTPRPKVGELEYRQAMSEAFDWLQAQGLVTRDASQTSGNWLVRTAKGKKVAEANDGLQLLEVDKLLAIDLHAALAARQVREKFARGDVEDAVSAAVKQVEVSVREAAGADNSKIGTKLMAWAFKPGEGPLHDRELDGGEQAGIMALYLGLIGAFKNPTSHRHVNFDDPVEAAEIILFADLLLRMLDRAARLQQA